jgi:formylglycine-generating enzyme required for sulfatase activity
MGEKVDMHIGGYHLTESIGTGGMGSVFRATIEADGKPLPKGATVAVKLLHPHLRTIGEFVKRFHREAKLAEKINHPNVVRVLDEGIDDRHHYIVMEYADGLRLSELMQDGVPLSPQQTIEVTNQVCEALHAAATIEDPDSPGRTRSLVHRDIKPDNIVIQSLDRRQLDTMTRTGDKTALANIRVKLLDFGLAKDVKALSTVLSQTGQSLGTPAYMSPEQCAGGAVDQRSDIYSLGVCAYQMITGTAPFPGPTTVAYAKQHAEEVPPDILKRNPLCPKNLADCIYRCLAKDPKDRYAMPQELQADLARVAKGQGVAKVYRFRKPRAISHRKLAGIVAGTAAVILLTVAVGWWLITDRAKADLAQAIQKADVAIAARDYAGAKKTLEDAIAAFPNRSDKAELTAQAHERLTTIAGKAAEQEADRAKADQAAAKARHEQDAIAAVADIKAKTAAGQYQAAIDAANSAVKAYADTPAAKDFPDLLAAATEKLQAAQTAAAARQQAEKDRQAREAQAQADKEAAEAKATHERFVKYRDEGDAAFNAATPNYAAAITAYEKALAEETDAQVKARLDACIERTTKQPVAVVDFEEKGDVGTALGVREAGQTVAELVLTRFGQDRYQLIERSQLANLLNEIDLTMAAVRDNPEKVYGKLKGVRYLVLGRVSKLGNIIVTARMVNVGTGQVVQTAEVSAEDARGLQNALGELVNILQMTDAEKKAYGQRKPVVPAPQAQTPPPAAAIPPQTSQRELTLDCGNGVSMKLALIPAGRFQMGSPSGESGRYNDEGPQHLVTISRPFYMGIYEVTQEQYRAVIGSSPSHFSGSQNPVEQVSWNDATEFCRKLSQQTGRTVRLPTEAEWEYACRAGTSTRFSFGDSDGSLDSYAWYSSNSGSQTHPVGQKQPNAWGLYDMHGNVWEWCSDWYADSYANANNVDPQGPGSGTSRVLRGGGWGYYPSICRSAYRAGGVPDGRNDGLGFRVAVDLK